jgi:hypothetical protein
MKLEWMAALLRPRDLAPHPNFPNHEYDKLPHVKLAAAVLGNPPSRDLWREISGQISPDPVTPDSVVVDAAIKTFNSATITEGLTAIRQYVQATDDVAIAAACALIGACALAEREDLEACEELLSIVLSRLVTRDPGTLFLRACLLQQRCLRRRDWAYQYFDVLAEVNDILVELAAGPKFPSFAVGPWASGDSESTMQHILIALKYAVWSLSPRDEVIENLRLPTHEDMLNFQWSEEALHIRDDAAKEYIRHVEDQYRCEYNSSSTFLGRSQPDLFYYNLRNELYGSGAVYGSRKELALLRLTQASNLRLATNFAECLSLLRYANADDELDLAIRALRLGGPLSALSRDARQVLSKRLTPERVRYAELSVIRGAAELLTDSEASDALTAGFLLIEAGSPTNVVGRWTAYSKRLELTWRTVVELANASGRANDAARRLLSDAIAARYDESVDLAYARALRALDWSEMTTDVVTGWKSWIERAGDKWSHTAAIMRLELGEQARVSNSSNPTLSDIAMIANDAFRGHPIPPDLMEVCIRRTLDALDRLRQTSKSGPWGMGGADAGDIAAVLISLGATELWRPLTDFLVDDTVPRTYRSAAFDRLARAEMEVDLSAAETFRSRATDTLWLPDPMPFDAETFVPYPAALRFLASKSLIEEGDIFYALTQLAGFPNRSWRAAAAESISVIADKWPTSWMLAIAVQLSHDSDIDTRGYAAHALAHLAGKTKSLVALARRRLKDLLTFDGIIVPLLAIRGLRRNLDALDTALSESVSALANAHPSRRVRHEAEELHRAYVSERSVGDGS